MQWHSLVFAIVALGAIGMARTLPNGMMFYQSAPVYYKRSVPIPHRMMYVQYVPQHASRRSATSGGVSAFAAGDTIATGTYLRDCNPHQIEEGYAPPGKAAIEYVPQIPQDSVNDDGASSVAEAYPESDRFHAPEPEYDSDPLKVALPEYEIPTEEVPGTQPAPTAPEITEPAPEVIQVRNEKKPKELIPHDEVYPEPNPTANFDPTTDSPALNDVETPIIPGRQHPKYIPPKKKIRVELEAPESDEIDYEHPYFVPQYHHKKNRVASSTRRPPSLPSSGTFFPIDFGGASGGAIAIANSFSTGDGGSATSTATAYGSPDRNLRSSKTKKRLVQG